MENKPRITLGIETSCDETSAAVYSNQDGLLSCSIYSQDHHKSFGGVVPEIGSRAQLTRIRPMIESALTQANMNLTDIDVVAVTNRPGLPGSLLVGVCFAKAMAWAAGKKLIGIDHVEGHVFSPFLEFDVPFPYLCLTVSGGHTSIYLVRHFGEYTILGETADDAAGEAFDKIARMLGLPYPGGPEIEKQAASVDFKDFFHYPRHKQKTYDFSFSGLKTAVMYDLVKRGVYDMKTKKLLTDDKELIAQVASSFLACVTDTFKAKLQRAFDQFPELKAIAFVGGVSRNKFIRKEIEALCKKNNISLYVVSPAYCTDNAAMIAFVGNYKAEQGTFSDLKLDILK